VSPGRRELLADGKPLKLGGRVKELIEGVSTLRSGREIARAEFV
jgi:hypothetical protein